MSATQPAANPAAGGAANLSDLLARGDIWRGDALAHLPRSGVASGYPELDDELPGGGWPPGEVTEILVEKNGIGELSLLQPALANLSREGGWIALVAPPFLPHAPAWQAAGIDLGRLLVIEAKEQAAWCCEQLLAGGGFAAVLAWLGKDANARSLRRLQVAAEGGQTLACVWRPRAAAREASPASLRLMLSAAPEGLAVHILKRRGRPMTGWRPLPISRPGRRTTNAVAGAPFPAAVPRSSELSLHP
ncbi:MAG: imuA [Rhodocyclaceae bacterium]|nr:imuA [Rhodocyclaceae bacterium]